MSDQEMTTLATKIQMIRWSSVETGSRRTLDTAEGSSLPRHCVVQALYKSSSDRLTLSESILAGFSHVRGWTTLIVARDFVGDNSRVAVTRCAVVSYNGDFWILAIVAARCTSLARSDMPYSRMQICRAGRR